MIRSLAFLVLLGAPLVADAQQLPSADSALVVTAAQLEAKIERKIWPDRGHTPSQLLLIGDSTEFFFRAPDSGAVTWTRPRVFSPAMQATFPAVEGIPTVVIGIPENTHQPAERWALTVLHEHLHQYQYSRPDYYRKLNALGLAHGDTTGMWALNYPFPYDSAPVAAALKRWADAMATVLRVDQNTSFTDMRPVRAARRSLDSLLSAEDRRYLDFQLWQEGVPRWTELAAARAGRREGLISAQELDWQEARLRGDLVALDPRQDHRVIVYALGAAVAELLEREGKPWRGSYFDRMFELESP